VHRGAALLILGIAVASTLTHLTALLLDALASYFDEALASIAIAGFAAQLVDGSLGMGYGLTSSTVLVASGLSPAAASASVHLAQLFTTAISGLAHYRFGNVCGPVSRCLAPPGAVGGFLGAVLISVLPVAAAKPIAGGILFLLGVFVLCRFSLGGAHFERAGRPNWLFLTPLGLVGGLVDATGGGGWGPVATSGLLADGRLPPSLVIGTVSLAEFFVTIAAVLGFCISYGFGGGTGDHAVRIEMVATLLMSGVLAAPIAPYLVSRLEPRLLGVIVGGFICFTNARGLLLLAGASTERIFAFYTSLVAVWATAVLHVARSCGKIAAVGC
jgi:uncharacterized membrane protein YfcA